MNNSSQRKKPIVVTLCGSTKFKKQFREAEADLTLKGRIVSNTSVKTASIREIFIRALHGLYVFLVE